MTEGKRNHHQQTRNFSYFEETMNRLNATGTELCTACGYNKTAWFTWRKTGKMPAVAGLACECLLRRKRKEAQEPAARDLFVLLVPNDNAKMLLALCDTLRVSVVTRVPTAE